MSSRTFTIIKPNAVAAGAAGRIIDRILTDGFSVCALKMVFLSRNQAAKFYAVHKGKPFFEKLIRFMTSGPIVVAILECGDDYAVASLRALVGKTDPAVAAPGTIRHEFGESVTRNAIHASDSDDNARQEWAHFFTDDEIMDLGYEQPSE